MDELRKLFIEAKKKNPDLTYGDFIIGDRKPSIRVEINGNVAKVYGEWNAEAIIKRLLKSESILKG
jgi:hypothetical protein